MKMATPASYVCSPRDVVVSNPHMTHASPDFLYHFGLDKEADQLTVRFADVKFVCCGGSASRLGLYAKLFAEDAGYEESENLSKSDRFCLYKTGTVLWVNHGMGGPSLSIMLVEIIKLLHYANCTDVSFIRLGTSGGIGVLPGTVVISSGALNGELKEEHIQYVMGQKVVREAKLDPVLMGKLKETSEDLKIPYAIGLTLCADDFYEGQGRLDGAFCEYTSEDKFSFLKQLVTMGCKNFEMESTCFAAMTRRANIKAAIVCVALLNRLDGDQVVIDKSMYHEFELRPYRLVSNFLIKQIASKH
uniref:PNP_UDP_1 domain-containing protein n=1 Tax=Rhabditophanes sp. KR3021 TaxID=114890 RepID=A0AC35TUX1_9BILA